MLLQDRVAVIYGGGGAIGGAMARVFAREGARIFLAGRNPAKQARVAGDIRAAGGRAETAELDVLYSDAVEAHAAAVAAAAGRLDIAVNAIGIAHVQGVPLLELPVDDFFLPVDAYVRSTFITARAAARHMVARKAGVIINLTTPAAQMPGPGFLGHNAAAGAVEAMTRHLAGELGDSGIRVLCLRSHAIPDAVEQSHSRTVFGEAAAKAGVSIPQMLEGAAQATLLKRLPTLAQIAEMAAFMASDKAGATTGAILNLTSGFLLD